MLDVELANRLGQTMFGENSERERYGDFMEWQIGHLLRRAYVRARKNSADALAAIGDVSPIQASALAALMDGPLSQADLGRRIDMERANIHSLVRRLINAGLAVKQANPRDRRLALIALSGDGRLLAARLRTILAESSRMTMAGMSADEQQQLISLLRKLDGFSA